MAYETVRKILQSITNLLDNRNVEERVKLDLRRLYVEWHSFLVGAASR